MTTQNGFLLIDKPAGMTSHDVVDVLRRLTGEKKIGHAGTLDPFATGLLIVAVGKKATTQLATYVGLDKTYEATFVLGATSTTDDPEGTITASSPSPYQGEGWGGVLSSAMQSFLGPSLQSPPPFSAIKVNGKRLYQLARAGKTVEVEPRPIRIDQFDLLSQDGNELKVRIRCSSGTYIRAIARDLGTKLGTGGYVKELRRTAIGPFQIDQAVTLDELQKSGWQQKLQESLPLDAQNPS